MLRPWRRFELACVAQMSFTTENRKEICRNRLFLRICRPRNPGSSETKFIPYFDSIAKLRITCVVRSMGLSNCDAKMFPTLSHFSSRLFSVAYILGCETPRRVLPTVIFADWPRLGAFLSTAGRYPLLKPVFLPPLPLRRRRVRFALEAL
ncbi:hypothetical protein ARMSODRAFT_174717 [Armillaria solidipes]|uniref:Uncharacterized protein n=1 Tax=Armillaria solidipes TaxID=1076256 RepID=A0A2H3BWX7_9AGAR|nr:hypothetical protein ARMSODRAFT_174717 [Armillaria solidipes]